MTSRLHTVSLNGNRVVLDTEVGHLRALQFLDGGRFIDPLHVAPWTSDALIDRNSSLAPTEQALAGDFLCAPFCASDVDGGPIHGLTANEPWTVRAEADTSDFAEATYVLSQPLMGAEVTKTLRFDAGQPFLRISHRFTGGAGELPISHHAMIHVGGKAALNYSPKQGALALDSVPEADPARGRSLFKYPSHSSLETVPLAHGGTVDIHTYPVAESHEDILSLVETLDSTLGWTAAVREAENDIVLLLKDARVLPITSLWMSNGGRNYAPWNGRHTRVLGIEDGRTYATAGHRASIAPNELNQNGTPTAFDLGTNPEIRYAIGAIARPDGWHRVVDVRPEGDNVILTEVSGKHLALPFAASWLLGAA